MTNTVSASCAQIPPLGGALVLIILAPPTAPAKARKRKSFLKVSSAGILPTDSLREAKEVPDLVLDL